MNYCLRQLMPQFYQAERCSWDSVLAAEAALELGTGSCVCAVWERAGITQWEEELPGPVPFHTVH